MQSVSGFCGKRGVGIGVGGWENLPAIECTEIFSVETAMFAVVA
jgi:hypothetical protein